MSQLRLLATVNEPNMILRLAAELNNLETIRRFVEVSTRALHVDQEAAYDLAQAVDECATNIVVHGYQGQPGSIEIEIERVGETLTIALRDHAPVFDPTGVPSPDLTQPLEEREPGGLGAFLARYMVDEMRHRALPDGGNELTMIKRAQLITPPS